MGTKRRWTLFVGPLCALVACAHARTGGETTGQNSPAWMGGSVTGASVADEGPDLAAGLTAKDSATSLAALDRTVDLFDAARFADDPKALDAMWLALGDPLGPSRGPEATADAVNRLLQAAWRIEDAAAELTPDSRRFLNDVIALLSVDLNSPVSAEDLSIQTSAYRQIAEQGHPRVADNARWRLYDHVRGVLEGTAEVPAVRRMDVAIHALYAVEPSVAPHLEGSRSKGAPSLPTPAEISAPLDVQRRALLEYPQWTPIVNARSEQDAALEMTAQMLLPVPREPDWTIPEAALGEGRAESLAPVVWARPTGVFVNPGHPEAKAVSAFKKELVDRLAATTAADGRATVLLVAPGELPSPDFAAILRGMATAELSTIELAVREPDGALTALPLQVVGRRGGLAEQPFFEARIVVSLQGRGLRASMDGEWLPGFATTRNELTGLLDQLRRAYPRERVLALELASGVQPRQLVDVLGPAIGGPSPRFSAVGWLAGGVPPADQPGPGDSKAEKRLEVRASLWNTSAPGSGADVFEIEQDYPLPGDDQQRLASLGESLARCLPELERPGARAEIDIDFEEGRATAHTTTGVSPRPKKTARDAFEACVDGTLETFRLRQQRDAVAIGFYLSPPPRTDDSEG